MFRVIKNYFIELGQWAIGIPIYLAYETGRFLLQAVLLIVGWAIGSSVMHLATNSPLLCNLAGVCLGLLLIAPIWAARYAPSTHTVDPLDPERTGSNQ